MKLQTKITLIILSIFIVFTVFVLGLESLVVIPKFEKINIEKAYDDIDKGLTVVDNDLKNMSMIAAEYAVRDDTYQFANNGNLEYINRNFTANTVENLTMSYIGIYSDDSLFFPFKPVGDSEEELLLEKTLLNLDSLKNDTLSGFVSNGNKTFMLASQRIASTNQSLISNDHLTFMRNYLDSTNEKLSKIPGSSLKIIEFTAMDTEEKQNLENLFNNQGFISQESHLASKIVYEIPDNDFIVAYTYLYDINGQPFAVLRSDTSNAILLESRNMLVQAALFFSVLEIILACIFLLYINRSIFKPIKRLNNGVDSLIENGHTVDFMKESSDDSRSDEIGELTKNIVTVSEDIKTARAEGEHINANLENIVLDRTKEIELAHQELVLYGEVFEETSDGLILTDTMGSIIKCNKAFLDMTGYLRSEIYGKTPDFLISNKHDSDFYKFIGKALIDEGKWEGEVWSKKKDGGIYPVWLVINTIQDNDENATYYVGVVADISTKTDMEEELKKMAFYDALTGLPNRSLFYVHFKDAILRSTSHDFITAVLYIDLDGFKLVNDTYGHAYGDLLLIEIGKRINKHIRGSDLVSRLGGDEFTVVLERFKEKNDLVKIANNLLTEIAKDFIISGEAINISASIGIAIFPDDGDTMEEIIIKADSAMYLSKTNGKNSYSFASNAEKINDIPKIMMISRLKKAIERSEFHLVYQPQIKINNKTEIFGAEALIRWTDENGQIFMPDDFIKLAEETGMIIPIGQWVIEEACRTIHDLEKLGKKIHISINVSCKQFKSKDLIEVVKSAIEKNQINPQHLFIEIKESIFAENETKALSIIKGLKALGVKIVLDDFGTGYSSLSVMSTLPFDVLKVDKSFVQNSKLKEKKDLGSIIISMAEILNIQSIIEGVDTSEKVEYYTKNGGTIFQGYYFSKPLEKEEFLEFISN